MHAMLKPAMRRTWRDGETVQFGVDPGRAVVLSPVDDTAARFLRLLDGTRGTARLRDDAAGLGMDAERTDRLLSTLARGGVLDDADGLAPLATALRHREAAMERLRPDLASLSLLHPAPGAAPALLTARRSQRVQVRGAGRVGAAVAAVLAAAGVGHVDVRDGGRVEPWDVAPAGYGAAQVGERRGPAARSAARRAAPDPAAPSRGVRPGGRAGPEPPLALAVISPRDGLDAYAPDARSVRELIGAGIPHLYAGVLEGVASVGPLVVPGVTGCAECLELTRAREDPAWPRVLAQLRTHRPQGPQACDVALATLVAGLAAAHALSYLDATARILPALRATALRLPPGEPPKHRGPAGVPPRGAPPGVVRVHQSGAAPGTAGHAGRPAGAWSPDPHRSHRAVPAGGSPPRAASARRAAEAGGAARAADGTGGRPGGERPPGRGWVPDGAVRAGAGTRTEFALDGLGMRVFTVNPHPSCPCGAASTAPRATMAG